MSTPLEPALAAALADPQDPATLSALRVALRQVPPDEALAALSRLPAQTPGLEADRGWLLVTLGRLDEAVPHLDRALAAGRDPSPFYYRAVIAAQAGELGLATELSRRALELAPGFVPARALHAEALLTRIDGAPEAARALAPLQGQELDPEYRPGLAELALRAGLPGLALVLIAGAEGVEELRGLALLRLGRGAEALQALGPGAPMGLVVAAMWVQGRTQEAMALVDAMAPTPDAAAWLESVGAERRARVQWRRLGVPRPGAEPAANPITRPMLVDLDALATVGVDERGAWLRIRRARRVGFPLPRPGWILAGADPSGATTWRPKAGGFGVPTALTDDTPLRDWLERQAPEGPHPALRLGLEGALLAALPEGAAARLRVPDVVANLAARFGLSDAALQGLPAVRVLDPFAPQLMLIVGQELRPLPEMPTPRLGPELINRAWWVVLTSLDLGALGRGVLRFSPPLPQAEPLLEGLVYWTALRLLGRLAALEGQADTPALWAAFDRVLDGSRALVGELG